MNDQERRTERHYYEPVRDWLELLLKHRFSSYYLEITADRTFSNRLKQQIPQGREMIFPFLKEAPPDITGFVKDDNSVQFIVVEIKNGPIKLDDIYQVKKYAELFNARYALLVSTAEIPEEIMRLSKTVLSLLHLPHWSQKLTLVHLDTETGASTWTPEDPFMKKA